MPEAWLGATLLLLLVLGMVRCVVAWLVYKEWQEQRERQPGLAMQKTSTPMKDASRPAQRWRHHAHGPRRRERHSVHDSLTHRPDRQ